MNKSESHGTHYEAWNFARYVIWVTYKLRRYDPYFHPSVPFLLCREKASAFCKLLDRMHREKAKDTFSRQRDELEAARGPRNQCLSLQRRGFRPRRDHRWKALDLLNRFDLRYVQYERRGDTGAQFSELQWYFFRKIMGERAAVRRISPEPSHSRGRRDNPRTAHIQENRSDAPTRAASGSSAWSAATSARCSACASRCESSDSIKRTNGLCAFGNRHANEDDTGYPNDARRFFDDGSASTAPPGRGDAESLSL